MILYSIKNASNAYHQVQDFTLVTLKLCNNFFAELKTVCIVYEYGYILCVPWFTEATSDRVGKRVFITRVSQQ